MKQFKVRQHLTIFWNTGVEKKSYIDGDTACVNLYARLQDLRGNCTYHAHFYDRAFNHEKCDELIKDVQNYLNTKSIVKQVVNMTIDDGVIKFISDGVVLAGITPVFNEVNRILFEVVCYNDDVTLERSTHEYSDFALTHVINKFDLEDVK